MYFIWFQSYLGGSDKNWVQRRAGVCKLGAKNNTEHPGIWHQFALRISVAIGL